MTLGLQAYLSIDARIRQMAQQFTLRLATEQHLPDVYLPILERVVWLRDQGLDQWSNWKQWPPKITSAIEQRRTYILLDGDKIAGTVSIDQEGDADFWNPEELAQPCLYLHKLATRPSYAGQELGQLMLDWARDYAYQNNLPIVRIDCWRSNPKLHQYYRKRGWQYVRTESPSHRYSGTLLQIESQAMPAAQSKRLTVAN